jgi:hypothetical protein
MIGAVIFVISFLGFVAATLGIPTLFPGSTIQGLLNIPMTAYPVLGIPAWLLINAIINGVVYGVTIWLIFSLVNMTFKRNPVMYRCEQDGITFATKQELETHKSTHETKETK